MQSGKKGKFIFLQLQAMSDGRFVSRPCIIGVYFCQVLCALDEDGKLTEKQKIKNIILHAKDQLHDEVSR